MENVAGLMVSEIEPAVLSALRDVAKAAEECGVEPFLVGGLVRDLFRGATGSADLDIALVGATPATFDDIARLALGEITKRSQFNTAAMRVGDYDFDIIMARSESYPSPGSLPVVRQGTLEEDLARRDFSVNAMAASLSQVNWGRLHDPHGGLYDLRNRTLRALRADSFRDDATRILRAARYASRLSLELSHETSDALLSSVRFMSSVSPARVRDELERLFLEADAASALGMMQEWGALTSIHTALGYDAAAWTTFSKRAGILPGRQRIAVAYSIYGSGMSREEARSVVRRLRPGSLGRRALEESAALSERISEGDVVGLSNSELAAILDPYRNIVYLDAPLRSPAARLEGGSTITCDVTERYGRN